MIHAQLPLRVPCYDFVPVTDPTLNPNNQVFRYYQLPWRDGRLSFYKLKNWCSHLGERISRTGRAL